MGGKNLYVFIEGPDDERFFKDIIIPYFESEYCFIKIIKYARKKENQVRDFIRAIDKKRDDYLFVSDMNNSPCISKRKKKILSKFSNLAQDKIIIVIREIESWYLAGLDAQKGKKLKIKVPRYTNDIHKEKFESILSKKNPNESMKNLKIEILKMFSIEIAKKKNRSFRYFAEKFSIVE